MPCLALILVLFLLPLSTSAAIPDEAAEPLTIPGETANPVIIPGNQLGSLSGKEIALVRVFSINDGIPTPIAFQIDQLNSRGDWVWDVVYQRHPVSDYEDDNHEGIGNFKWDTRRHAGLFDDEDANGIGTIDDNDLLVFMAKDMGSRAPDILDKLANAWVILEVELSHPSSRQESWAYIAYYRSDPPPHSPKRYVRYIPDSGKIVSSVYEMEFSKDQVAVMEQLKIGNTPLMDRTKLRGSVLLGRSPVGKTLRFNENNIHGHIEGYINGPVRVIKRNSASLRFGLVFSSPEIHCDQYFYAYHSEIPVSLPFNILMDRASLLLAADYHNSPFIRAYIGGVRTPFQLQQVSSSTNILGNRGNVPWMALDGDIASVVSALTLPEDILPFTEVTPYLVHNPDLADPPESYRGSEPEAGYVIKTKPGFPHGNHTIVGTYLYLPGPFSQSDATQILDLVGSKPDYRLSEYIRTAEAKH